MQTLLFDIKLCAQYSSASREGSGIPVSNCSAYGTPSVAQHVFLLMLALSVKLFEYNRAALRGDWGKSSMFYLLDYPIMELSGKTLGIVDYGELAQALKAGVIGGAGVDVLIEEPPCNGNVLLDPEIPNLIVTPHSAWASLESRQRIVDITVQNIQAYLIGEGRSIVNGVSLNQTGN